MVDSNAEPAGENSPDASPGNQTGAAVKKNGRTTRTMELSLPRVNNDLRFKIDEGATDATCKLIAFLSPKGGSGKTGLATNLGKVLQSCGYNILLLDADFTTKSLTNLIFPCRKVIIENRTSYYRGLLDIDEVKVEGWLKGIYDGTHILPIDTGSNGKRIDILPSSYSKEQQSSISNSIFLRESRNHNLSSVV